MISKSSKKNITLILVLIVSIGILRDIKYRINNNKYWINERALLGFELTTINYVIKKYSIKMPYVIYQNYDPGSRVLLNGYQVYPDSEIVVFMNVDYGNKKYRLVKCNDENGNCKLGRTEVFINNISKDYYLTTNQIEYSHREMKRVIDKIEVLEVLKAESSGYNLVARIIN